MLCYYKGINTFLISKRFKLFFFTTSICLIVKACYSLATVQRYKYFFNIQAFFINKCNLFFN